MLEVAKDFAVKKTKRGIRKMKKLIKKLVPLALLVTMTAQTASAFNFPEPDWGSLLKQRRSMATLEDFELYTEGSLESAKYYGARLEPRSGCYIGMIANRSDGYKPLGSYLTYIEDMQQQDLYYPDNALIEGDNVIATIGWTVTDLNTVDYDAIKSTLDNLSSYNKPMFIRFANEMNESALGNEPDKYVEIFRNVANIVHRYDNFAVVWSPNDFGALDRPFEYYYPGDEYVDWIGVSTYSIKYFGGNKESAERDTIFFMTGNYAWPTNKLKPLFDFIQRNNINKPVMISEGGVSTNNKYDEDLQGWANPRLRNMLWYVVMKYPQVKLINYFNQKMTYEAERFNITEYEYASNIYKEAAASGAYIREYGKNPEFVFQPASAGETLGADNGIIRLYTLAFFHDSPDITVNYFVDDKWYRASNQIPYICKMNVNDFTDGEHTLRIHTSKASKTYTFYKKGSYIRFGSEPDAAQIAKIEARKNVASVTLNGKKLSFDQNPVIVDGRTLVPMRAIFEAFGADVEWYDSTKTVMGRKGDTTVRLTIGSNKMDINGTTTELDVPPSIINSRTMVPVRAISEAFDCNVSWNQETKTVLITK